MTNRRGAAEPSRLTPRPLRSNLRFLTPSTKAFSPITPGPPKESRACRASIGARRRRLAREAASGRSRERAPDASGGEYRLRLRVEARRRRGARRLRASAARSSRGLGGTALDGRATPTSETPEGFALLFFAPTSPRPMTRAAWRRAPPGLPDPLAHLVCKFWLGEPPRRRRAAPATE